ncbi:response regulator receiver modulated diguanylate cyclase [Luteibacter rhizovicinus]|uniref:Response regulator receiver modulated diguanylate cyclase n=1 Tax=Luteibacter rhizovicinus TaxID=242606 RepID=A0A4R3YT89_9GAMM|nr:diguanylate cyclase [Luteibacter rhizovicinus]TCV95710.1 response regulator receiver modulated diguanylate cyclase [Luteibacter rhizovicinus]
MNALRPKILVVDDTPANLVAMRRLLARADADIFEAGSGNDALALCLDHQFALVLLDVNMPEMDGFEVAQLIAEADQLRETPIIFVTAAYGDDVNRMKGYTSGAVDYIAKPINDVILQSKVRIFLELYRARALLQQALDELSLRNTQLTSEVAERTRMEELVRHQATHDALTGLPNRVLFRDRLLTAIDQANEKNLHFGLAYIDIDGFKNVNDEHGHGTGDALLQAIASRLNGRTRADDTVARLGGDEFAVLLKDATDANAALARCQTLCDAIAEPYTLDVHGERIATRIGASIGVAMFSRDPDGDGYDRLVARADTAMYEAKRSGKNRCVMAPG